MSVKDDEITDVDDYLHNNPKFAKCRRSRRGHKFPHEDDVPVLSAYNDSEATHEQLFVCARCGSTKRSRFRIIIRRGRVTSYTELDPRIGYVKGYVAKGVRISPRYAREVAIREYLEDQAATARRARRSDRRRTVAAPTQARAQRGRKAAVA